MDCFTYLLSRCCVKMKRSDIFDDSFRLFLVCSDPDVAPGCLTNVDSDGFKVSAQAKIHFFEN